MRARELFERAGPAAPVEAPPKPGTKPSTVPGRPAPTKHPNPFRRRRPGVHPGPMPKPKACAEGVRDWLAKKADLAREVVRPNQSASYRKFRAKELIGADPEREGVHFDKPYGHKKKEAANESVAVKAKTLIRSLR